MRNGTKVTLESLYNLLFTIGVMLLMVGVGLIEAGDGELAEGLKPIGMGIVLIAVGAFIYWLKIQGPQTQPNTPINDIITPEQADLPKIDSPEKSKEVEDRYG